MNKFPLISIIISNYNGARLNTLQECLESFVKLDYPNFELILVDNASVDNSINFAKKIFGDNKKFRIIKNPVNMYSQGINLGFKESMGEYIALFNNDIEPEKGYLQKLYSAFKKYPKLGIVQGKLISYFDHSIIDSAGETMDIYGNPVTLGYQAKDEGFSTTKEILSATGAACLIKKTSLLKVGGYDSDFGIGYEDMDHSLRFRQNGFTVMSMPDAVCFHKRGVTDLSPSIRVKVRWHFNKNRLSTMIRNYPLNLLIKALPVTILIYIGSFIWESLTYKNTKLALTRIHAIYWVVINLPKLIAERKKIRRNVSKRCDKDLLGLFAPEDIKGKIKAVIADRISGIFLKIKYFLPWSYPAEIKRLIPVGASILDIGCGDGHLMGWINFKGEYRVTGVDINSEDLKIAKNRLTEKKEAVYQEIFALDLNKTLPFRKKFDVVLCSQVVEHLKKNDALTLIRKIEKLAKKRIIVATINGFFQFNHRLAGKHDVHLSGWFPGDFISQGYKVQGSGLKFIYKPGAFKDKSPKWLHVFLFLISYISTPLLRNFRQPALLLISYKDINEKN